MIPEFVNTLAVLQYAVTAPPAIEQPVKSNVFSDVQPIWLYDEIDVVSPGVFSHSILVSNSLVVTIHFRDFRYLIAATLLIPNRNGTISEGRWLSNSTIGFGVTTINPATSSAWPPNPRWFPIPA